MYVCWCLHLCGWLHAQKPVTVGAPSCDYRDLHHMRAVVDRGTCVEGPVLPYLSLMPC